MCEDDLGEDACPCEAHDDPEHDIFCSCCKDR